MRLAVTGTHGSGKSTLIDDLIAARPDYESVAEPYWLLAAQGRPLADEPTLADFEEQLEESCSVLLADAGVANVVFDRCPLDFLAYLDVVGAAEGVDWTPSSRLLTRIGKALSTLDRIVFLPLQMPDEIGVAVEYPKLRRQVDARLKQIVRQDDLGLLANGPTIVEVWGTPEARLARVLAEIGSA